MSRDWSKVTHFSFLNDHLFFASPPEHGSRVVVDHNDGKTIRLYYNNQSFIASNVGADDVIIAYDVRPQNVPYKYVDGKFIPHIKGDIKIEGFYPNYRALPLHVPVYLGPHLFFYTEPQRDIVKLANEGKLRAMDYNTKRECQTCGREIAKTLGPRARYCSEECGLVTRDMIVRRQGARKLAKRFELPKIPVERKCEKCDGPMPKGLGPRARFCSVECGLVTREMQREPSQYKCECCGTMFRRSGRQIFCSEECKPAKEPKTYPCDYCGTPFVRSGRQRFCSEKCKLRSKLDGL